MSTNTAAAAQIDRSIKRRFEIIKKLGQGGYGIVWKAYDRRLKQTVALKKVIEGFRNRTDAQRTYREIMLLHEFNHDNIVKLYDVLKAENDNDIYLVFEFMDTDLAGVLRCNLLGEVHKRYVMYQLCRAMFYLHSSKVLHRDLKPSNLLMDENCHLKVCDFGLARVVADLKDGILAGNDGEEEEETPQEDENGQQKNLTLYQATRWYSPPEVLLGSTDYSGGVDMWGVGCIMAEMYTKNCVPLFRGTNTQNQIMKILEVSIPQGPEDIQSMKSPTAEQFLKNLPRHVFTRPVDALDKRCPDLPAEGIPILQRLLSWNPNHRPTAADALQDPFFAQFFKPEHLNPSGLDIKMPIDDNKKMSVSSYRSELYILIEKKHSQLKVPSPKEESAPGDKKASSSSSSSPSSSSSSSTATQDKEERGLRRSKSAKQPKLSDKQAAALRSKSGDVKSQIKDDDALLKKPSSSEEDDKKQKRRSYHFGSQEEGNQLESTSSGNVDVKVGTEDKRDDKKKEEKVSFFKRLLMSTKKKKDEPQKPTSSSVQNPLDEAPADKE